MEPLFRIAIVENEPADAEKLHALLDRYFQEVKESFSIDTYGNAFDFIEDAPKYNLVFMDIEMPGITGMEASFKIRESNESLPLIIFVTNMAQFAIDGYKVSALDFCLKPITYEDLFIPMEKARSILQLGKERYYIVKTKTELIKIPVSKI
ncbi:MAG: response regulator, partial [Bacilli bacterium]|nr:response regulator [Bacilli bacterium]